MRSLAVGIVLILVGLPTWVPPSRAQGQTSNGGAAARTSQIDGLAAWQQVYSVLTHPRCINCHTATSYPQQGDDRHRHFANVVRGPEGKGVPALSCATCHQETNADSTGVPAVTTGISRPFRWPGKTRMTSRVERGDLRRDHRPFKEPQSRWAWPAETSRGGGAGPLGLAAWRPPRWNARALPPTVACGIRDGHAPLGRRWHALPEERALETRHGHVSAHR